ncbi:Threonyl and Alanyl tRNA synthetase second additional domain protein, partial [mine drainage metagenome]
YIKETRSTLVSNVDNLLEFDRTIFYPTGGGQPLDTGTIRVSGKSYNVIDVIKKGDALLHKIDSPLEASKG